MTTVYTVNLELPWVSSTEIPAMKVSEPRISLALGDLSFTLIEVLEGWQRSLSAFLLSGRRRTGLLLATRIRPS